MVIHVHVEILQIQKYDVECVYMVQLIFYNVFIHGDMIKLC